MTIILDKPSYKIGEKIKCTIVNNSQELLSFSSFYTPSAERYINGNWEKIKNDDDCLCTSLCERVLSSFPPNKKITFEWDQNERYCDRKNKSGTKILNKQVAPGKYRMVLEYNRPDNRNEDFANYVEFEIVP